MSALTSLLLTLLLAAALFVSSEQILTQHSITIRDEAITSHLTLPNSSNPQHADLHNIVLERVSVDSRILLRFNFKACKANGIRRGLGKKNCSISIIDSRFEGNSEVWISEDEKPTNSNNEPLPSKFYKTTKDDPFLPSVRVERNHFLNALLVFAHFNVLLEGGDGGTPTGVVLSLQHNTIARNVRLPRPLLGGKSVGSDFFHSRTSYGFTLAFVGSFTLAASPSPTFSGITALLHNNTIVCQPVSRYSVALWFDSCLALLLHRSAFVLSNISIVSSSSSTYYNAYGIYHSTSPITLSIASSYSLLHTSIVSSSSSHSYAIGIYHSTSPITLSNASSYSMLNTSIVSSSTSGSYAIGIYHSTSPITLSTASSHSMLHTSIVSSSTGIYSTYGIYHTSSPITLSTASSYSMLHTSIVTSTDNHAQGIFHHSSPITLSTASSYVLYNCTIALSAKTAKNYISATSQNLMYDCVDGWFMLGNVGLFDVTGSSNVISARCNLSVWGNTLPQGDKKWIDAVTYNPSSNARFQCNKNEQDYQLQLSDYQSPTGLSTLTSNNVLPCGVCRIGLQCHPTNTLETLMNPNYPDGPACVCSCKELSEVLSNPFAHETWTMNEMCVPMLNASRIGSALLMPASPRKATATLTLTRSRNVSNTMSFASPSMSVSLSRSITRNATETPVTNITRTVIPPPTRKPKPPRAVKSVMTSVVSPKAAEAVQGVGTSSTVIAAGVIGSPTSPAQAARGGYMLAAVFCSLGELDPVSAWEHPLSVANFGIFRGKNEGASEDDDEEEAETAAGYAEAALSTTAFLVLVPLIIVQLLWRLEPWRRARAAMRSALESNQGGGALDIPLLDNDDQPKQKRRAEVEEEEDSDSDSDSDSDDDDDSEQPAKVSARSVAHLFSKKEEEGNGVRGYLIVANVFELLSLICFVPNVVNASVVVYSYSKSGAEIGVSAGCAALCLMCVAARFYWVHYKFSSFVKVKQVVQQRPDKSDKEIFVFKSTRRTSDPLFAQRYTLYFDACRDPERSICRAYVFEEFLASAVMAVVGGFRSSNTGACKAMSALILIVALLHLLYAVVIRPYRTKIDGGFMLIVALVQFAMSICVIALQVKEHASRFVSEDKMMEALGYLTMALFASFFVQIVAAAFWAWVVGSRREVQAQQAEAEAKRKAAAAKLQATLAKNKDLSSQGEDNERGVLRVPVDDDERQEETTRSSGVATAVATGGHNQQRRPRRRRDEQLENPLMQND